MEKEEEESELEEETKEEYEEDSQEIDEEGFTEFMSSSGNLSPSLRQIRTAPELRATDLEQDLSSSPEIENNLKEEDPFKYSIGSGNREEVKYLSSGEDIERVTNPSQINMIELGREQSIFPQEIGFSASPSSKIGESSNIEKYTVPDRFDMDKSKKQDPFKKQEVKYKSSGEY